MATLRHFQPARRGRDGCLTILAICLGLLSDTILEELWEKVFQWVVVEGSERVLRVSSSTRAKSSRQKLCARTDHCPTSGRPPACNRPPKFPKICVNAPEVAPLPARRTPRFTQLPTVRAIARGTFCMTTHRPPPQNPPARLKFLTKEHRDLNAFSPSHPASLSVLSASSPSTRYVKQNGAVIVALRRRQQPKLRRMSSTTG